MATYEDPYIEFKFIDKSWKLKIRAELTKCIVDKLTFDEKKKELTYDVGTAKKSIAIPGVTQDPECLYPFNRFKIKEFVTNMSSV